MERNYNAQLEAAKDKQVFQIIHKLLNNGTKVLPSCDPHQDLSNCFAELFKNKIKMKRNHLDKLDKAFPHDKEMQFESEELRQIQMMEQCWSESGLVSPKPSPSGPSPIPQGMSPKSTGHQSESISPSPNPGNVGLDQDSTESSRVLTFVIS